MVLQPAIFSLINATPFFPPPNPGLIATYPPFALTPAIKMIDNQFKIDKNMINTYTYIHQAIYKLLVDNVLPQYQASNTPGLTGWGTTMTIIDISPNWMRRLENQTLKRSSSTMPIFGHHFFQWRHQKLYSFV